MESLFKETEVKVDSKVARVLKKLLIKIIFQEKNVFCYLLKQYQKL